MQSILQEISWSPSTKSKEFVEKGAEVYAKAQLPNYGFLARCLVNVHVTRSTLANC